MKSLVNSTMALLLGTSLTAPFALADSQADAYLASQPEELRPLFSTLLSEGERNSVLNFDRLGLAAMQRGDIEIAEHAFDQALARIEAVYADDPQAKKARSLWSEEKVKDFKGEPYERAMAYYYRGVLYLAKGDYENARASFMSGEYQDTMSEKEEYRGDFAVLSYLAGWASRCNGDSEKASSFFKNATDALPGLSAPEVTANSLVLIDTGAGPRKIATGKEHEMLSFESGESEPQTPSLVDATGRGVTPTLATNVNWQAETRGGRPVQGILNGKATWKSTTGALSDTAVQTGVALTTSSMFSQNADVARDMGNAGAILGLVGLFGSAISSAMRAEADTRYWETLPGAVFVAAGTADNAQLAAKISGDESSHAPSLSAKAGACSITWISSGSRIPANASAPNSLLADSAKKHYEHNKTVQAKNQALQASIVNW
jgi:hypothetical protein